MSQAAKKWEVFLCGGCVCRVCVSVCVSLFFFSPFLCRAPRGQTPYIVPPSQSLSNAPLFTKSTVASAPSDALLWGTAARPRRRTARYTACCAATERCKPRRGSRPERWPPSPELWECDTASRPWLRRARPLVAGRGGGSLPYLSRPGLASSYSGGSGTRSSPGSGWGGSGLPDAPSRAPTGTSAAGSGAPARRSAPWRTAPAACASCLSRCRRCLKFPCRCLVTRRPQTAPGIWPSPGSRRRTGRALRRGMGRTLSKCYVVKLSGWDASSANTRSCIGKFAQIGDHCGFKRTESKVSS